MPENAAVESLAMAHQRWQAARQQELSGPDSWRGLIGLFWLQPGENMLGSSPAAGIQLPDGPACRGKIIRDGEMLLWQPADGTSLALQTDSAGTPTTVDLENYRFFVVDRDKQLAVRLRNRDWARHQTFSPLEYFPFDQQWRIEAVWETLPAPCEMVVPNVTGELKTVLVSHQAVFQVAGETVTLLPMSVSEKEVFFVFRDRTSGKESYGAGRFLKVPAAVDGKISLDFNFACNPPCAFTPFATCPLPPPENWLPFAVPAGEKKPLGK